MNYLRIFIYLVVLNLFSCTDRFNFTHYNEIKIVKTTRDSTYYKDGLLFSGLVRKYVDDKLLLSFSLMKVKSMVSMLNIILMVTLKIYRILKMDN